MQKDGGGKEKEKVWRLGERSWSSLSQAGKFDLKGKKKG